jgi:hypothetical protein
MTEVISVSVDIGKPIRCPVHVPGELCVHEDCRFRGECRQADGIFGKDKNEN